MQVGNTSMRSQVSRWLVFVILASMVLVPSTAVANDAIADGTGGARVHQLNIEPSMLPTDRGQSDLQVYIPETGHSISGTMLDYWRANGGASVYGNPISEPYEASNGYYSQAFERGVFQYLPDFQWTDDPIVRLQPIGASQFRNQRDVMRADGRRVAGDRRMVTTPASEDPQRLADVQAAGGRTDNETGFSISGDFAAFYDSHEGWFYLGSPISEPFHAREGMVQLYQNGMLMDHDGDVVVAALPRENPDRYGIDTAPIAQANLPVYSERLFISQPNPFGVDTTNLTGRRWIDVDISDQFLTAYQGDTIILQTPVSTGVSPNETEIGAFHVRLKYDLQDMKGFTSSTGEVVSVGTTEGGGNPYLVKDVPNVMYFDYDAEALHGAYWHNNFGNRMSHGCVNLPLDVAAFMYQWAPLGTAVNVHE